MDKDTEVRNMRQDILNQLCRLLDSELSLFMGSISVDLTNLDTEPKFTSSDVDKIRTYAEDNRFSPINVLFGEWGSMGRNGQRATAGNVLALLIKCQLFRAADYLARELGQPIPQRPASGPAALVDISLSEDLEDQLNRMDYPNNLTADNQDVQVSKAEVRSPNMQIVVNPTSEVENSRMPLINPGPSMMSQSFKPLNIPNGAATTRAKPAGPAPKPVPKPEVQRQHLLPTTIPANDNSDMIPNLTMLQNSAEQSDQAAIPLIHENSDSSSDESSDHSDGQTKLSSVEPVQEPPATDLIPRVVNSMNSQSSSRNNNVPAFSDLFPSDVNDNPVQDEVIINGESTISEGPALSSLMPDNKSSASANVPNFSGLLPSDSSL